MMFEGKKSPSIPARKLEHSIRVKQMQKQVAQAAGPPAAGHRGALEGGAARDAANKTPDIKNMRDTPLLGARAGHSAAWAGRAAGRGGG